VNEYDSMPRRRFFRNSDKAMIAGVCAGIADYFGFNLRVTRFLTVIVLLVCGPVTLLAYFGMVLLVPSNRHETRRENFDPEFRQALRSDPARTLSDVKRRFQSLDNRLARLERYVTSSRFNLDQEFRNL
jgi:phage shock protein C